MRDRRIHDTVDTLTSHLSTTKGNTMSEQVAPTFQDDMQKAFYEQIAGLIKDRNALVGQANAVNGDKLALQDELTENSTDPQIVAAREARDEAIMALDSLVRPLVNEIVANSEGKADEFKKQIGEIDEKLTPGKKYYKTVYGDDAAKALPDQLSSRGLSVSSAGTSKRIRGFNVKINYDGELNEFENFASAAKYLDMDTSALQEAFLTAAGNPDKVKDAPDEVQFTATFTETDENEVSVEKTATITAYRTEPTAEKAATEPVADEAPVAVSDDEPAEY